MKKTVWRLKAGADRRFRSGHPWVYSNELSESPKGLEPGAPVELCDAGGAFLARGYGNPHSLIAFRAVSRSPELEDPGSAAQLLQALTTAGALRTCLGLDQVSHRLCFGEADRLPGLVIDRYRLADAQVFSVQAHTAGADRWLASLPEVLEQFVGGAASWQRTAVVFRNDVGVRKLEGIDEQEPRLVKNVAGLDLAAARIRVAAATGQGFQEFEVDLLQGQKTGFFLDQVDNVRLAAERLGALAPVDGGKKLRILDLCCYVGQWSTQLSRVYKNRGLEVAVTAVDASAGALERAARNIEGPGIKCETLRGDVLKDLASLPADSFDLVIVDPPALIKGRKDMGPGTHAYLTLNTQAFRLVKARGAVISSSCSGLLEDEDFLKTLSKAAYRNGADARWVARGGQSGDHPALLEFPEGRYLKAWIGWVAAKRAT